MVVGACHCEERGNEVTLFHALFQERNLRVIGGRSRMDSWESMTTHTS